MSTITALHYFLFTQDMIFHDLVRILYYIPIIYGAFTFKLKGGLVVSSLVVVLYAPHLLMYFGQMNFAILYQLLELLMFIATGLGAGYLVQKDHLKRESIEQKVIKITNLENYNHNILDSLDSGVVAFSNNGKIKFANKVAKNEFNDYCQINSIFSSFSIDTSVEEILKGKRAKANHEIEYSNDVYEISCFPLRTITDSMDGVVVIIKKVTTLKALEEQVRRGERLAAIGTLAAGIAHEIRNPLGIIKTISQTVQSEKQCGCHTVKEGLEIIDHEINRANEVVKWLLDFARHDQYKLEAINLSDLITQLGAIFNKYSEGKHVNIELNVENDIWVYGDVEKLKQTFVNIMLNGIQSIEGEGSIKVSLNASHNKALILFKDTGVGIKRDIIDKIFNPFFTTKDKGTGLGLAITHKIIEQHQGTLSVNSEVGKGTTVEIQLRKLRG